MSDLALLAKNDIWIPFIPRNGWSSTIIKSYSWFTILSSLQLKPCNKSEYIPPFIYSIQYLKKSALYAVGIISIEAYFNQIKTYMKKNRNVNNYEQLEKNVDNAIDKVKPQNYKNYFEYAYNLNDDYELKKKPSTRRRKLKIYK